jgi:hypothetical protein
LVQPLPQIVDFSAFWRHYVDLLLTIYDFQLFGLQVFAPMYFSAENRKSFMGLNQQWQFFVTNGTCGSLISNRDCSHKELFTKESEIEE